MTESMQQCFDNWRAAQPDGGPTLRQELAYQDGFADALKLMHARSTVVLVNDVHRRDSQWRKAGQAVNV